MPGSSYETPSRPLNLTRSSSSSSLLNPSASSSSSSYSNSSTNFPPHSTDTFSSSSSSSMTNNNNNNLYPSPSLNHIPIPVLFENRPSGFTTTNTTAMTNGTAGMMFTNQLNQLLNNATNFQQQQMNGAGYTNGNNSASNLGARMQSQQPQTVGGPGGGPSSSSSSNGITITIGGSAGQSKSASNMNGSHNRLNSDFTNGYTLSLALVSFFSLLLTHSHTHLSFSKLSNHQPT